MLTAAVESNAEELKGVRKQLEDMRVDRDKEKTSAKESRVQNGVLRMRLAAAASATDVSSDEIMSLNKKIEALEKSQLERATEEVRKLAALEQARDEATAATAALQKRMNDADAEFKRTLEQRASRIAKLESDAEDLAAQLEGEKAEAQKTQSENKEHTRVMIIKETELRETKVRETLKETHRVEVNRLVETHTRVLEEHSKTHALALAEKDKARADSEKELAAEQERRRKNVADAAAAATEARKKMSAAEEEIARLQALIAT